MTQVFVGEKGFKPTRGSPDSAGWDLYASEDINNCGSLIIVPTDLKFAFPPGYYGRIAPRSGLAVKKGIDVFAGVVDRDYRGEVKVVLYNTGGAKSKFTIARGDRIAQLVVTKYNDDDLVVVDDENQLGVTVRGEGGFGSTGVSNEQVVVVEPVTESVVEPTVVAEPVAESTVIAEPAVEQTVAESVVVIESVAEPTVVTEPVVESAVEQVVESLSANSISGYATPEQTKDTSE